MGGEQIPISVAEPISETDVQDARPVVSKGEQQAGFESCAGCASSCAAGCAGTCGCDGCCSGSCGSGACSCG